jgi:hypothetical protein
LTSLCCPLPFVEIVTYKKMLLHLHIVWFTYYNFV